MIAHLATQGGDCFHVTGEVLFYYQDVRQLARNFISEIKQLISIKKSVEIRYFLTIPFHVSTSPISIKLTINAAKQCLVNGSWWKPKTFKTKQACGNYRIRSMQNFKNVNNLI